MSGTDEPKRGLVALVCGEGEFKGEKGESRGREHEMDGGLRKREYWNKSLRSNVKFFTKILSVKYFI